MNYMLALTLFIYIYIYIYIVGSYNDWWTFYLSAPEFDFSELESLFSANVPKPANSGDKSGGRRKSTGSKPDKVHLVFFKN